MSLYYWKAQKIVSLYYLRAQKSRFVPLFTHSPITRIIRQFIVFFFFKKKIIETQFYLVIKQYGT